MPETSANGGACLDSSFGSSCAYVDGALLQLNNQPIKGLSNRYSHQIRQDDISFYFTAFGAYLPRSADPPYMHIFFWFTAFCFGSYTISALALFFYTAFVNYANQQLWVLFNATTFLKCIMLYIVLGRNAKQVVSLPKTAEYGKFCSRAYPVALRYFAVAVSIYSAVMIGWAALRFGDFAWYFWILFAFSIVGGTFEYVCYVATVMLFCVADTYLIHRKIENLKMAAEEQILTKQQYVETHEFIANIKKETFRNNELILFSVVLNSLALGIVLFTYQTVTTDRTVVYTVWFLMYVTSILWVSDLLYLFSVLPSMSKSNDLFAELHVRVAAMNWEPSLELQRHDVLHMMLVQPIRIKMFGLLLTKAEMRNRLLGMTLAILSITIKFVVEVIHGY